MRDYYRRSLLDRWDDLLCVSRTARDVYHYLMLGPPSTCAGMCMFHVAMARRDLDLRPRELDASLVELVEAGVLLVSDVKRSRMVAVDPMLAEAFAPKSANGHIGWVKLVGHVPECEARAVWESKLKHSAAQLPESTGFRGARGRLSVAKGLATKKEIENKKENKHTEQVRVVVAAWRAVAVPAGLRDHRWTDDGLPKGATLRKSIEGSVRRGQVVDYDAYFRAVVASDFLSGRSSDFQATLSWLCGPKNEDKVLDGNYTNRGGSPSDGGLLEDRAREFYRRRG